MKIEDVRARLVRLPLPQGEWGDQIHRVTHIELVIVDLDTDVGIRGTGVSHTSGVGGRSIVAMLGELREHVLGATVAPRALWDASWRHLHDCGGGGITTLAIAGLDLACWDALGNEAGAPVADLLGRVRDRVPLYGSGINLHLSAEEVVEQVRRWRALGYHAAKVKVGKADVEEDVDRLARIRQAVPDIPLMVDANQGWTLPQAVLAIERYRPFNLTWVEEPLLIDDVDTYGELALRSPTPIGLGENVYTSYAFQAFFNRRAMDYVQADIARVGGVTPYLDIAGLARARQLPMAPHFIMEISAQVCAAVTNVYLVEDTFGGTLRELGALRGETLVKDGYFLVSDRPGLGLEWDREFLEDHSVEI